MSKISAFQLNPVARSWAVGAALLVASAAAVVSFNAQAQAPAAPTAASAPVKAADAHGRHHGHRLHHGDHKHHGKHHGGKKGRVGHHDHHGLHFGLGGPRLQASLDAIQATEAQRAQILGITEVARKDLKLLHEQHRAQAGARINPLEQVNVDAAAAEQQRLATLTHHDAVSKRVLQAQLAIAQALTPEQRGQLAEQAQARKAKWEARKADARDKRQHTRPATVDKNLPQS